VSFRPEDYGGQQTLNTEGVQALLRDIRATAGRKNPEVRGINIHNQILAKNNGFPKFLYPPADSNNEPVFVLKQEEEDALVARGYTREYTHREFPKAIYRRNMHPKFAGLLDDGTPDPAVTPYVETRVVKDEKILAALMKATPGKETGPWVSSVSKLEPLPEDAEDPALVVARLQGQLDEAQRKADRAKG
jgi:hypothetical protein